MTHAVRFVAVAVLVALALCAPVQAQTPEIDALRARAEQGDAEAQNDLGNRYANGDGVSQDDAEAVRWYRLAADQGFANAQYNLLSWRLNSAIAVMGQQQQQIQALTTALGENSKQHELTAQTECSAAASRFLVSRGWKITESGKYTNHFNARLNKCFVLITQLSPDSDFISHDLHDALEGHRYALFTGRQLCEAIDLLVFGNPARCALNSGQLWFDGNDSRKPADITVKEEQAFSEHVRQFMFQ